jgi:hypothetical protein
MAEQLGGDTFRCAMKTKTPGSFEREPSTNAELQ